MRYDELIGKVMRRGRFDADVAHKAAFATVRALGEVLDPAIAATLKRELPERLGHAVLLGARRREPVELWARVAAHEGGSIGAAKERGEVVCRALAEILHDDLVLRMGRDLGQPELFAWARDVADVPPYGAGAAPLSEHTLAGGKPGSAHPVSESRPELAHAHSVARSADPHADTKLSSARGLTQERDAETLTTAQETTQEREHRTLATGKP